MEFCNQFPCIDSIEEGLYTRHVLQKVFRTRLIFFLFLVALLGTSRGQAQDAGSKNGKRTYSGKVAVAQAEVRAEPRSESNVLAKLAEGTPVQVISQSRYWYRVMLRFRDGIVQEGWIEKGAIHLPQGPSRPEVSTSKGISPSPSPSDFSSSSAHSIRLLSTPVFNIYQFKAFQLRVGGAYDHEISDRIRVGVPISYSFGDGFTSIQGGLEARFQMLKWGPLDMYSRAGGFFDRFSGNGRSFIAGTVDVGWGFSYEGHRWLSFFFEPISVEVSPIATNDIPLFVRGQAMLNIGGKW